MMDRARRPRVRSTKGNDDQENMMGAEKEIVTQENNQTPRNRKMSEYLGEA
jgi:hypothetical protein